MQATIRIFAFLLLLLPFANSGVASARQETPAEPKYDDWLIVDGEDIQFRVRIDVVLPNGQPASDFSVQLRDESNSTKAKVNIDSNRITVVSSVSLSGNLPELAISTNDDRFLKIILIHANEVRRIAATGLKVTLDPVQRTLIRVVDEQGTSVADATVISYIPYIERKTDENGFVTVSFPPDDMPGRVDVIGPDNQVASVVLKDLPADELYINALKVTLQTGHSQIVRVVDDQGNPVPGFSITPQPMDRIVKCIPVKGYPAQTDERGEARVIWIPDAPGDRAFFAVYEPGWQEDKANDERTPELWTVRVKLLPRTTISGKVELPDGVAGGFAVRLSSYDHPSDNRADQLYCRTDEHGNFTADVLPNANYCVYLNDSEWASSYWDGIIVENDGTSKSPELTIDRGIPVRVVCTQGPDHLPMVNTPVSIDSKHMFKTRNSYGQTGPTQHVKTDANGVAQVFLGSGDVTARIYTSDFNDSKNLIVRADGKNEIRFHRKNVDMQTIAGKLEMPEDLLGTLNGAKLQVYASDGKSRYSKSFVTADNGEFEMQGIGERFAIFATTADERAAGFVFFNRDQASSIQVPLVATQVYRGQIADSNGEPIAGGTVMIDARLSDPELDEQTYSNASNLIPELKAVVNTNGEFEFANVPAGIPLTVWYVKSLDGTDKRQYVGQSLLTAGEERPKETIRVGGGGVDVVAPNIPLEERFAKLLIDCRVNKTNALIILAGAGKLPMEFISDELLTSDKSTVFWYFPMAISNTALEREEVQKAVAAQNWKSPGAEQMALVALDHEGTELGQLLLDVANPTAIDQAQAFLETHKGPAYDAREKLDAALQQARDSNRKVWAIVSGTRCGPCILLARWIDDHHELLDRDYVFVKIDAMRDRNGIEVTEEITSGEHQGIPFFAILDPDGQILIDANGPLGNIGYPAGSYEGRKHLRTMLEKTTSSITAEEIDELIKSLDE